MIITITGSRNLSSDISRLTFGVVSYMLPRHSIRVTASKSDTDEATAAAIERHMVEARDYEVEVYKTTNDSSSYLLDKLVVTDHRTWNDETSANMLHAYTDTTIMNRQKLGQLVCSVQGGHLDNPSEMVIYVGGEDSNCIEERVIRNAANDIGALYVPLNNANDVVDIFSKLGMSEY